jgi:hypothetical protein
VVMSNLQHGAPDHAMAMENRPVPSSRLAEVPERA